MSLTNDFLAFATGGSANVESQADYSADSDRTNGNQPGVASSALNNKALRQGTYVVSQFAQFLANQTNMDLQDNATPAQLLSQIAACIQILPPYITTFTSTGSFTYNLPYVFFVASANASSGATYTDSNSNTFTVLATISSGTLLYASGADAPATGGGPGTLSKASGTGDSTITYYAVRAPINLVVEAVGGGAGGGGVNASGGSGGNAGSNGANTTFGSVLTAGYGSGGSVSGTGGPGGAASITGVSGIAIAGNPGGSGGYNSVSTTNLTVDSGAGGNSFFGGGGNNVTNGSGGNAATNSGSGGGGSELVGGYEYGTGGGGAGGYCKVFIPSPSSQYTGSVGTGGGGGSGSSSHNGGNGGAGIVIVVAEYN
jgi:hypothetical protein